MSYLEAKDIFNANHNDPDEDPGINFRYLNKGLEQLTEAIESDLKEIKKRLRDIECSVSDIEHNMP